MREAVYLATKGVLELDAALKISPARRMALCIIARELDGEKFDVNAMRFRA